jgi:ATP-dependent Clp protease ATP-binding subunit ClpA
MKGLKPVYEKHHHVSYTDDAIKAAVELSARYIHDRKLPDKAIDVIDEVGAAQMLRTPDMRKSTIEVTDIEEIVAKIARIPPKSVSKDDTEMLRNIDRDLKTVVFGQDKAIGQLAAAIKLARAGLRSPEKPIGSYLLAGPTGVGKTEVTRQLARLLGLELIRFDMSEYMERHSVSRLIGAPPGYVGFDQGGLLTDQVNQHPHCVILFDEIEKAHTDVFNVFLQVLDDGRLTDNRGLTVSFSEAIIIMTTNIGQSHFLNPALDFEDAAAETIKELDVHYRPEFLNRFNGRQNIVCFKPLPLSVMERIARREIDKLNERVRAQGRDLTIAISDESLAALCRDQYVPANGARGIPGYFATFIHPAVANAILETQSLRGTMEVVYDSAAKKLAIRPADGAAAAPTASREPAAAHARA